MELICNLFQLTVDLLSPTISRECIHTQKVINRISFQLSMTTAFNQEVYNQLLVEFLITNFMETSNLSVSTDQTKVQGQTIQSRIFNILKTSHQFFWPLQSPQTSTFKRSPLETQVFSTPNLPDHRTFRIHIPWSFRIPSLLLEFQIWIIVKAASIILRLIPTKTIEITTSTLGIIRFKVTIRGLILKEECPGGSIITMVIINSNSNSRCSFKSWTWVRACKSRFRHSIRTHTTIRPFSRIWWTPKITSSIKIRVLSSEITMDHKSKS